uniref:Serine/threonine-protein phosphatase n=1 Tax=Dermatophagoides pteronyssinus TaxID=6956 RepID=A0A6P6Y4E9_DERPT|nr:serine/threonine-protein phosphatase 5-like [Dermatophagoides pteronyssinus]
MLISAPTGSGKTNIAFFAMIREIQKHLDAAQSALVSSDFKIVYVSPLKALVAEQVATFRRRFDTIRDASGGGIAVRVCEMSGDSQLREFELAGVHVLVCTPEKFSNMLRFAEQRASMQLIKLLIIDEIHMLHQARGWVLEEIVTSLRLRAVDVRFVGLSATIPNCHDIADFLHLSPTLLTRANNPRKGLFVFDDSFRPIPLAKCIYALESGDSAEAQDALTFEFVVRQLKNQKSVLVFVQSRQGTVKVAQNLLRSFSQTGDLTAIFSSQRRGSALIQKLKQASKEAADPALASVVEFGFGFHHGGMSRADRDLVEALFRNYQICCLVCTSTLAWGVNLPASCVIVRGTTFYDSTKNVYAEMEEIDLLQITGRAGRPPFDQTGLDAAPDWELLLSRLSVEGRIERNIMVLLINQFTEAIAAEPNVLELEEPLIIVGDIHGQFYDFVKILELGGAPDPKCKYLFLGDYVDRGQFGIEVLAVLMALKIKYPDCVWLLRGNHESRQMTTFFNFRDECVKKYDAEVYNLFMEAFDCLPLCARVNRRLFTVHGGLSPGLTHIDQIKDIVRTKEPPRTGVFCDLLWSDPIDPQKHQSLSGKETFLPNDVRGCSYVYGFQAAKQFLEENSLLSIIRAHEAQLEGYKMYKEHPTTNFPTVITIFSAPNYCDIYDNKAAILRFQDNTVNIQQFLHTPHPYVLPNCMDMFEWSIPFLIVKLSDIFHTLASD